MLRLLKKTKVIGSERAKCAKLNTNRGNESFRENWILITALKAGREICGQGGTHRIPESQKLQTVVIFWVHNEVSFLCFTKTLQKRQSSKKQNLPRKKPFHTAKLLFLLLQPSFALLCFVLKSYKIKIWLFYNAWHVMFLALEFSLEK